MSFFFWKIKKCKREWDKTIKIKLKTNPFIFHSIRQFPSTKQSKEPNIDKLKVESFVCSFPFLPRHENEQENKTKIMPEKGQPGNMIFYVKEYLVSIVLFPVFLEFIKIFRLTLTCLCSLSLWILDKVLFYNSVQWHHATKLVQGILIYCCWWYARVMHFAHKINELCLIFITLVISRNVWV